MTVAEIGVLTGIIGGGGAFVGTLIRAYKARPETQTLVMSTGETGVKILDNVIDTLQSELARQSKIREQLEAVIKEQDALFRQLRDDLAAALQENADLKRRLGGDA